MGTAIKMIIGGLVGGLIGWRIVHRKSKTERNHTRNDWTDCEAFADDE